jgi:NAD(P)-dependent dehydrogenase (short-subunit alcohol dehydrogenase family)
MKKLENKTAIVTGAASGMGAAIATLFAQEGAHVVIADLHQEEMDKVVKAITTDGGKAIGVICNASNEDEVSQLIEATIKKYKTIDVLVNNAGVMDDFVPVDSVTNDLWQHVLGVNLNGPFYACRLVVPIMLKQGGGVIVNISSVGGLMGARAGAAYTTSKHALIGLTKNIGFMYANSGIRCNAIAPGGVNTSIGKNMKPNPFGYERCVSGAANMSRIGEPDEIAKTALFLACNDSSLINATVITADGGWTAY